MSPEIKHTGIKRISGIQLADEINHLSSNALVDRSVLKNWNVKLCANLKEAYEKTPAVICIVELVLPGGPSKSLSKAGIDDPRAPGDEETEYGPRIRSVPNPHKQELLDQALALGCAWAKEEATTLAPS